MPKIKAVYICQQCGYESPKWSGRCPSCGNWNTMSEEPQEKIAKAPAKSEVKITALTSLKNIESSRDKRMKTNITELDRTLSGGIVQGSLTLIGGDPGIGKSTLLLQICEQIGKSGKTVLYVSGEESAAQIKLRAERLQVTSENLLILPETNLNTIQNVINQRKSSLALIIIDSIQTVYNDELSSAPGSVTQVRECTGVLMRIAKGLNISIIIVGHVTKDGAIAGPRVLEHMVDTVLYFEGERHANYRILRSVKNRFGSTNEIGVFEMSGNGLNCIANPSEFMLSGRPQNVAGSVVTCALEGSRPILVEVQALVCYTNFGMPRRMASGVDFNRVSLLIAVLEKRAGFQLGNYDSYINLAGGLKINEPAVDSSALLAIGSSYRNSPVDPQTVVIGEVGLTGEVRAVNLSEKRVLEAQKLGFKTCIVPFDNAKTLKKITDIEIIGIANINELLDVALK